MRSAVYDILPPKLKRSLNQLGGDINIARRRRRLSVATMAERLGIAKTTYQRVEKGDPTVSLGVYAMTFFVLGFGAIFADILAAKEDEQGLILEAENLPKRIRRKKS